MGLAWAADGGPDAASANGPRTGAGDPGSGKPGGAGSDPRERVAYDEDVGRWAGRKLLPGASETEARQPEQPGALPVTARFGLRGPVPCPGGAPDGCLELWWSEEVDAAVRARACAARDRLAAWKHEETTTELVVLAEAATLLPRRARSLTTTRSACPEGFLPGEVTSKAEREYEWRR